MSSEQTGTADPGKGRTVSAWDVLRWLLIATGVAIAVAALWSAIDILFLLFAGILIAVFLRGLAMFLNQTARIPMGWSLLIVCVVILGICGGLGWLFAPRVADQADVLSVRIPESIKLQEDKLSQYTWGRTVLEGMRFSDVVEGKEGILARATKAFSVTLDFLGALLFVIFVGLYTAVEPMIYVEGLTRLAPPDHRALTRKTLLEMGLTLKYWLLGQIVDMAMVAVLTALGLWIIGVPLALTLGLIAGLLTFVSYIGPIVSTIPAALLGLTKGPIYIVWVILLFVIIHIIEGYLFSPWVQRRTVYLPPALTLFSQIFLGVTVGLIGLLFAVPLVAAGRTAVKLLYIRDVAQEPVQLPGHPAPTPPRPTDDGPPSPPPKIITPGG